MDSRRLSPDFPYDTLIAHAAADHADAVQHPLDAVRAFVHTITDAVLQDAPAQSAADDAYLAGAGSYAELRHRFNELATHHNAIPLDPNP